MGSCLSTALRPHLPPNEAWARNFFVLKQYWRNKLSILNSKVMDSLKYCLVWAAALCYVVVAANTEGEKVIGTFSKTTARGPLVQGTVSVLWDGSLKIKDYKMPEQDVDSCRFFFYIGSKQKGTVH